MSANEIRHVSYSQYSMWKNCPHAWKLAYVDKIERPLSIELIFGSAMHTVLEEFLQIHYNGKNISKHDLHNLLKSALIQEYQIQILDEKLEHICTQEIMDEYFSDGKDILDYVIQNKNSLFPTKDYELVAIEFPLEKPIEEHSLKFVGYIDYVIRQKSTNHIFIYDFKTSKKGWGSYQKTDEKKLHQLLLYKSFYSDILGVKETDITVKFMILKRKLQENSMYENPRVSLFEPVNGKISINKARKGFANFLSTTFDTNGNVLSENLKPTPSKSACMFCAFKNDANLCDKSYYLK